MRHKLIKNIRTRFHKRNQIVILGLDNDECVILHPNNINQNTGIQIYEIELLIGSKLRIDFFKIGEITLTGRVCDKDDLIVKEYYFELSKPIDKLRIENTIQLLPFKKIINIFHFTKFNKENVGIKTEDGNIIYLPLKRFEFQSNLEKSEQHILVGSYICPEYYNKGDRLSNGIEVHEDHKVLKWINLRYSARIEQMHIKFEDSEENIESNIKDNCKTGSEIYGYRNWEEMTFDIAFEGDMDAWNHYNQ